MSTLFRVIVKTLITLFAGIGTGAVLDKVAADKLPNYESGTTDLVPGKSGFRPMKLLYLAAAFIVGGILVYIIGKKMRIRIFK